LDSNDYSVDRRAFGRFVDVHAAATMVTVTCHGDVAAARHPAEGRQVTLRALSDYDVLFSSDFTAAGAKVTS
jgi:hypothetical protein